MKVLLVWNGPANEDERSVLARRQVPLLNRLAALGVHPTLALCGDAGGLRHDLDRAGIDFALLPTRLPPAGHTLAKIPLAVVGLRQLIRYIDPTVLEGDEPMPAIAAGLASRARRQRVVVYRRHHAGRRAGLLAASRLAARLADRTFVSSETMRTQAAEDDRIPLERIDVAASGALDPPAFAAADLASARHSLGIGEETGVVVVVSRLRRDKGIDVLLHALRRLEGLGETRLVIAGTGPEESALRRLAEGSPIPVHFIGHRTDVDRWLAVADVVAIPSREESFGRVTLEAMAAGRPIVATRAGGLAEAVVDHVTGRLVPPEDPGALAEALGALLGDRKAARRMGAAARARFESCYTLDHMAASWRAAWERALAGDLARRERP